MPHLDPPFAEEFYVDRDPRMLALDFWSYINARQANLGWAEADHRLWWHLETALAELKPVLIDPEQERFRPYLLALTEQWRSARPLPTTPPGAAEEAEQVRRELAGMLADALRQADTRDGDGERAVASAGAAR